MTPARKIRCDICREQTDAITAKPIGGLRACPQCFSNAERRKKFLTPSEAPPWLGEVCDFVGLVSRNMHWLAMPDMRRNLLLIWTRLANQITTDLLKPPPRR